MTSTVAVTRTSGRIGCTSVSESHEIQAIITSCHALLCVMDTRSARIDGHSSCHRVSFRYSRRSPFIFDRLTKPSNPYTRVTSSKELVLDASSAVLSIVALFNPRCDDYADAVIRCMPHMHTTSTIHFRQESHGLGETPGNHPSLIPSPIGWSDISPKASWRLPESNVNTSPQQGHGDGF